MSNKDISNIKTIDGGICAVKGVKAAGVRNGKYGIALILSENSYVAGAFTSNKITAAPVDHTKNTIKDGKISLIVANSGNANCFTGEEGIEDCKNIVDFSSELLKIQSGKIATASTGVVGRKMPMEIISPLIKKASKKLENSIKASQDAAKAIMTTDTIHKECAVQVTLQNNNIVNIGGICKGTGMIAPNMATMLCFIATDGKIKSENLKDSLKIAIEDSFNMLSVDGDESTNDTVLFFANSKSKNEIIDSNGEIDENFQEGLNFLCKKLAKQMAYDGEGATKFIEVNVIGAKTKNEGRLVAKSVVNSSLVKTAIFGEDPNWGRIVVAIGYSKAEIDPENISISLSANDDIVDLVKDGEILAYDGTFNLKKAENIMKNREIKIIIDLKQGFYSATTYGCDLSYDYVKINAEYTT
ncbi:MAG: bifunctional ornithine acetyltransferase/N-acetylglutamate synthase [Methanobacteriaceae archaeon]|jgi:glutamate N-acetyltransferase/amino-acid N-acetyltransferase|nr:bifunctional ornithine acetyltransferase/N-acetylglutamate synthase [Candidatus Methanorudis spinitermitis]